MKANTRFGHSDALLIFDIEIFMSFGLELDLELFRGWHIDIITIIGLEGIYSDE